MTSPAAANPVQPLTWLSNPDMVAKPCRGFPTAANPVRSLGPSGTDALYSGLLECPITDKVLKGIEGGDGYAPQ